MRTIRRGFMVSAALAMLAGSAWAQGAKPITKCPADAVVAGTVCMDKYEASVWRVANATTTNASLVKKIQQGKATAALLAAAGATQLGIGTIDNYAPCSDSGQNCTDDIFAVSLPGVPPSATITYFQSMAACENSRKRLPTSAEWQAAVIGTPDSGPDNHTTDCNTNNNVSFSALPTGSRSNCKSARGAFDMVGNVSEWVADWVPRSPNCGTWSATVSPTSDFACMVGPAATTGEPGAIIRGGAFLGVSNAGPLAIDASRLPSSGDYGIGFRCAR